MIHDFIKLDELYYKVEKSGFEIEDTSKGPKIK